MVHLSPGPGYPFVRTIPIHPIGSFRVPSLGIHPTLETWAAQLVLIGAAGAAYVLGKRQAAAESAAKAGSAKAAEPPKDAAHSA